MSLRAASFPVAVLLSLAGIAPAMSVGAARATTITTTLGAPGQYTPQFLTGSSGQGMCNQNANPSAVCVYGTESFSSFTPTQAANGFTSSFNTGSNSFPTGDTISGAYSGQMSYTTTDQYGGVPGSAGYPTASGVSTYVVDYSSTGIPGINYLGVWISALDQNNEFSLLTSDGTTYDFSAVTIKSFIDASPLKSQYYGNPTPGNIGADSGEPFAYLNFYVSGSYFTQMKFRNVGTTGFESSNHAVGYFSPLTMTGAPLTSIAVSEPASLALLIAPGTLMLLRRRARRRGVAQDDDAIAGWVEPRSTPGHASHVIVAQLTKGRGCRAGPSSTSALHDCQQVQGQRVEVGRDTDFAPQGTRTAARRLRCGRRPDLGHDMVMRGDKERLAITDLAQDAGQVGPELAHTDPLQRMLV